MLGTRYRLDSSWRRPAEGQVVVAGSPLRLFRLSTGGAQVAAMLEHDAAPDTAAVHQLLDRFVEAGALHPLHDAAPFTPADVTVVVPAYGEPPRRLLRQLADSGVAAVIVVDDASPQPFDPGGATCLRHPTNRGPAAARNTGLAAVATPLVAFVDTDVVLTDDWLRPLLAHFADPQVALVAPRVAGAPGDTWLHGYEQRHGALDLGTEPARIAPGTRVSYVPAAALLCRTEAVRGIGGFDEAMRLGEDVDLVWRLVATDHRCRFEPIAVVYHQPRPTARSWLRQRFGYGRSAAPLAARHHGALAPVRMSGWSALVWLLLVARRPLLAVAVAAGTTAALARKLHDLPVAESMRLAGLGHLAAGRQLALATVRVWWPLALVGAVFSRRARLTVASAFVLPTVYEALHARSWRPLLDLPARTIDQVSYGAGVWAGVLAEHQPGALLPEFTNWPPRGAR